MPNHTPLTYYPLQLFSIYSMRLFFRDVAVIGQENVPTTGPVILYGNHNNQFVDGTLMMANVPRSISFIAAAVSCRRTFVGPLIRATGAIPVERPQDIAYKGKGNIVKVNGKRVFGQGTKFSEIKQGQMVLISQLEKKQVKFQEAISDTEFIFEGQTLEFTGNSAYQVIPKLQYNKLYEHVWSALNDEKCIGIFPQGGSHDQMQLLPLKAGICIMALGAMQKYGKPVKLVSCGFNYYNPSKFRSRVVMQFGQPYTIPEQLLELYRKNKKQAIAILLTNLEQVLFSLYLKMLRQVTTQFSSFKQLNTLFLARQLYTMNSTRKLTMKEKLILNRRFAKGFRLVASKPEYKDAYQKFIQFSEMVRLNGIKITKENYFSNVVVDLIKFIIYLEKCILRSLVALPGIVLMGPTTGLISYLAEKERIKCKKNSKVKQQAHDVVGSYKVLLSMFLFPATALIHSTLLYTCLTRYFNLPQKTSLKASLLSFLLLPIYALLMVKSYDSFGQSWTKLKYLFWRLFNRGFYDKLNQQKKQLSKKILEVVERHGNEVVGDLEQNRILKRHDMAMVNTELYIFDEDELKESENMLKE